MENQLVSVIVPCFNQAQYLEEALDSVLAQTYPEWECIIVNDGSPDNTAEIAEKYCRLDERFKYVQQENSGVAAARNNGIQLATGAYILPLDADDRIDKDYLLKATEIITNNNTVKLVYSDAEKFGTETGTWQLPEYNYERLLTQNLFFCTALFKRTDFFNAGMYDIEMLEGLEDWELWIRLLNAGDTVKKMDGIYFYYRINAISRNKLSAKTNDELRYRIYLKHIDSYKKYFPSPVNLIETNSLLTTMYKNSSDYRLGNLILNPFRQLLAAFRGIIK